MTNSAEAEEIVSETLREVGNKVVLAIPLGLGKANHIANAFFDRAAADPSIDLEIFTGLTLEAPKPHSDLERRFLAPIAERLFAGYPPLRYAEALRSGHCPANIKSTEFFFLAGRWLSNPTAQQNYVAANYTHVVRRIVERGVNVVAQLVAKHPTEDRYSLSCNTDLTLDLLRMRDAGEADFKFIGQVNRELPYMPGEAELPASAFSRILDTPETDFPLFSLPKESIGCSEYAIGLHAASLVPDGGTLQIGIGKESDALAHALILRHRQPDQFRTTLQGLGATRIEHGAPFEKGLHGLSEMLVDAFLPLIDAGVLKREVGGALVQGGFFLGSRAFYRRLREMPEHERARLHMTAISFTNELYGDENAKRASRVGARFVNNAMMATLLGAVVSDGLAGGHVVSGVGGQYNFVSQAFALPDARSLITLKSTRTSKGRTSSNVVWTYGHETVPRHLRDIVVTEYGIADLRGKSDRDVVAAMLAVANSRYQDELLRAAKGAGKIERSFVLPAAHRNNSPGRIEKALKSASDRGLLPPYPFGTDFTAEEQRLVPALETLATASLPRLVDMAVRSRSWSARVDEAPFLARLDLTRPRTGAEWLLRMLVRAGLRSSKEA